MLATTRKLNLGNGNHINTVKYLPSEYFYIYGLPI